MTIFFIHTPKTSGTTFIDVLSKDRNNRIGYFYPSGNDMLDFEKWIVKGASRNVARNPDWSKYNFIAGHFTFGIHNMLDACEYRYLGVIRDPVQQYFSFYKTFLSLPPAFRESLIKDQTDPINALIDLDVCQNMQTFFYSGLSMQEIKADKEKAYNICIENYEKHFAGVFLTERFDEGLFYLKHLVGIKPRCYLKKNVSRVHIGDTIRGDLMKRILEANDIDIRLYEYFSKKFDIGYNNIPGVEREVQRFRIKNKLYKTRRGFPF